MKRISFFVLMLFVVLGMIAENPSSRHEIEVALGEPLALRLTQMLYKCGCGPSNVKNIYDEDGNLTRTIEPHYNGTVLIPSVNLKYHYNYSRLFAMGAIVGYELHYNKYELDGEMLRQMSNNVYAMFSMRLNWLHKEIIECYSGLALGIGLDIYNKDHKSINEYFYQLLPALQLSLVGIKVGSGKVYWNAEIGYGDLGFFNTGIGFRL